MIHEKKLNIVAPVYSKQETESFLKSGASEVYCGVLEEGENNPWWNNIFNTRDTKKSNLSSFDELKELVSCAHSLGGRVSIAVNKFFSPLKYPQALKHVEKAADCGVDAFIISDMALILELKKYNYFDKGLHISSMGNVFNNEAVSFYKELGASRIIFPLLITLSQIKDLAAGSPDIEFEAFILNERCFNLNGLCGFVHGLYTVMHLPAFLHGGGDFLRKNKALNNILGQPLEYSRKKLISRNFGCCAKYLCKEDACSDRLKNLEGSLVSLGDEESFLYRCGACSLYDLSVIENLKFIKIVGRNMPTLLKKKSLDFISELRDLAGDSKCRDDFVVTAKKSRKAFFGSARCDNRYCYY